LPPRSGSSPAVLSEIVPKPRVLIAHPGATSLLYPLVGITSQLDVTVEFHTSFYFTPGGRLDRALGLLPASLRARVRRDIARRSHPDVDPRLVHQHPLAEAVYMTANRAGWRVLARESLRIRNDLFDSAIARLIRRAPPDLYIGFDGSAKIALEACRAAGVPSMMFQAIGHIEGGRNIMMEERRLRPEFAADTFDLDTPAWRRRNAVEALLADHVVVPSIYVRDTLLKAGRSDKGIHLLPYPIDTQRFRPSDGRPTEGRGLKLLFAGHVGMRKGVVYILEALRKLGRPDITLKLVGAAPEGTAWLEAYRGLFEYVPSVPYAEMPALFQAADAFVFPSLHEGSAMVVNEALASGLPSIVTPNAGSIVRDGIEGFIVPIRNVDAIALRIAELADDPAKRHAMGEAARRRAEAHDFAAYKASFARLIEDVLGG
jgi:starch synthase